MNNDHRCNAPYTVRLARPQDLAMLPEIERQATSVFREVDLAWLAEGETLPEEVLSQGCDAGRLWLTCTAEDVAVGFLLAPPLEGQLHAVELSVSPQHQRRGLGACLVKTLVEAGRKAGFASVTLTTYRHLPWNAAFYARQGL